MTTQVQYRIDQRGTAEPQPITLSQVEAAWDESIIAADLYEVACMRQMPRHVIEARREEMCQATDLADKLWRLYWEQGE